MGPIKSWWCGLDDSTKNIIALLVAIVIIFLLLLVANYPQRLQNQENLQRLREKVKREAEIVCKEADSKYIGDIYYLHSIETGKIRTDFVIYECADGSLHKM